jgi:hypothetical protein
MKTKNNLNRRKQNNFSMKFKAPIILLVLFLSIHISLAAWWDVNWQYRKAITIDNRQNPNTLTDYQVAINLTYSENMQPDFDDIRFTWYNSIIGREVQIPHWIENKVDSQWAYIWVKVPYIPGGSYTTIHVYYGNPYASNSTGDPYAVFELFDDFEDGTVNTTIWNTTPNVSETSGYMILPSDSDEYAYTKKKFNVSNSLGIRVYLDFLVGHVTRWTGIFGASTLQIQTDCSNTGNFCGTAGPYFTIIRRNVSYLSLDRVNNTAGDGQIIDTSFGGLHNRGNWTFIIFSDRYSIFYNNNVIKSLEGVTVGSPFIIGFHQFGVPNNIQNVYNIYVTKYTYPEPTYYIGESTYIYDYNDLDKYIPALLVMILMAVVMQLVLIFKRWL